MLRCAHVLCVHGPLPCECVAAWSCVNRERIEWQHERLRACVWSWCLECENETMWEALAWCALAASGG